VVENQLVSKKPPKSPEGGLVELLNTKGYYPEIKIIKKLKIKSSSKYKH
jgi:hypothetical protein